MTEFFKKNEKYIYPLVLLVLFFLYIFLTWGRWGHVIADCFREAVIPQALLDGKILYSDITCLYPPLAYQFNALLFKIFGNSVNVLYCVGIVNSLLVLSLFYFIIKRYSSDFTAFLVLLTVMEIFTFRIILLDSVSWFFPYSYAFLYAFTSCFLAFIFYVLYKENYQKKFLYLSVLFSGLSIAFKLDFLLFILLPLYEIVKNKSFRDFCINVLLFILPLFSTYLIWFLTGGSFEILGNFKDFLVNFSHAPSVIKFNDNVLIQTITKRALFFLKLSGFYSGLNLLFVSVISFFVVLANTKLKNMFFRIIAVALALILGYIFLLRTVAFNQLFGLKLHFNLVFLPYLVLGSAVIVCLVKKFKKTEFTKKEKFWFIVLITAFLMSYRIIAAVFISYIGNFIMIFFWLAFIFLLLELLPEYFPVINKSSYKQFISVALILYGLTYSMIYASQALQKSGVVTDGKNKIYTTQPFAKTINEAIAFVRQNSSENDTILVSDEGIVINYFSGRKCNLKYYALIPHMVDTYGEDKIINDLKQNPPKFVLITNNFYPFEGCFGINYAKKITQYFFENYDYVYAIKNSDKEHNLEITVLKKK